MNMMSQWLRDRATLVERSIDRPPYQCTAHSAQ